MDEFTRAYIHAAAWTQDPEPGSGEYPEPDHADISPAFIAQAIVDCAAFQESNRVDLETAGANDSQHGHDLWLTRNGHGAGFWDRGYGELGARLTDAALTFGEYCGEVFADGREYAAE